MKRILIENHIPVGRENAITRTQLCVASGLSDRKAREEIEQARRSGVIIVNAQDGAGYFRTDDLEEIKRQYDQNEHRARSILVQQKFLRRRLKDAGVI